MCGVVRVSANGTLPETRFVLGEYEFRIVRAYAEDSTSGGYSAVCPRSRRHSPSEPQATLRANLGSG